MNNSSLILLNADRKVYLRWGQVSQEKSLRSNHCLFSPAHFILTIEIELRGIKNNKQTNNPFFDVRWMMQGGVSLNQTFGNRSTSDDLRVRHCEQISSNVNKCLVKPPFVLFSFCCLYICSTVKMFIWQIVFSKLRNEYDFDSSQ